jgi:hypothetical protein
MLIVHYQCIYCHATVINSRHHLPTRNLLYSKSVLNIRLFHVFAAPTLKSHAISRARTVRGYAN